MDAAEVWLCFVLFQSAFAAFDKDEILNRIARYTGPLGNVLLVVNESAEPDVHEFHYGQIVWSFYDIGVEMARRYPMPTGVHSLESQIYTPQRIGAIRIYLLLQLNANTTHNGPITARREPDRKALTAPRRGDVKSVDDPNLVLYYQFDGRPVQPDRMLTAFLRSMTFCSEHDEDELDAHLIAFSADWHARLRLYSITRPEALQLSWHKARLALRTLWMQVVMGLNEWGPGLDIEPRWESFSFLVEYRGVRIGQGWLG